MDEMRIDLRKKIVESAEERPEGTWSTDNLRWLLQQSETKMKGLEAATGIKMSSLRMYQSGHSNPSVEALIKIADYFRVPTDFLLGRCTERENGEIFGSYAEYFRDLRDASYDVYLFDKYMGDDSITTNYISTWPFNLIEEIYHTAGKNECIEFDLDGLMEAISTLLPREIEAVRLRYKEEMALNEVAERLGVTPERARQIVAKACRKLRHPSRMSLIQYGNLGVKKKWELQEKEIALKARQTELDAREKDLDEREAKIRECEGPEDEGPKEAEGNGENLDQGIEHLDLSVRSYNCLKRSGCRTMQDAAQLAKQGRLMQIRNLGRKSLDEILYRLKTDCGLDYFSVYYGQE